MYESPITVCTQLNEILEEVHKKQEDYVYDYLFKIGVDVNKEELIKALKYDREQYNKGYKDGLKDGMKKLAERLKERYQPIPMWGIVAVNFMEDILEEMEGEE